MNLYFIDNIWTYLRFFISLMTVLYFYWPIFLYFPFWTQLVFYIQDLSFEKIWRDVDNIRNKYH